MKSFEEPTETDIDNILEEILDGVYILGDWETDGEKIYYTETHILK